MSYQRVRIPSKGVSDVSPQAGWVFADLLLALAIIFLTSISFDTPGNSSDSISNSPSSSALASIDFEGLPKLSTQTLTLEFKTFDRDGIFRGIQEFENKKLVANQYKIIYAQIIGGYDQISEGSEQGSLRATSFLLELQKARMTEFDSAGFDISTSNLIKPGFIVLRLAFAEI
jgi:hypothetical protein